MQTKLFFSSLCLCLSSLTACYAQVPLPGNGDAASVAPVPAADLRPSANAYPVDSGQRLSAPAPAQSQPQAQAPTPGRTGRTAYGHLPLTVKDAKNRLVELRTALAVSHPHDLQEPIYQLSEWLGDSADAHNKMAAAFAKHDEMKAQYNSEKQIGLKFSQLKRDAQLLKADLLIAQKRYPEALAPLVEIVLADPTSATGKTAYQRLKDLGFSHDSEGSAAPATAKSVTGSPDAAASSGTAANTASTAAGSSAALASSTDVVQTAGKAAVKAPAKPGAKITAKTIVRPISVASKRRPH
jgi:hypothetical protein